MGFKQNNQRVLSEVDKDFYHVFMSCRKVDYYSESHDAMGKFNVAYFMDRIENNEFLPRNNRQNFRDFLSAEMKKLKILEVGERCGFADLFGTHEHIDDFLFLNPAIQHFSGSNEIPKQEYDLIHISSELLMPSRDSFEEYARRWAIDKYCSKEKTSYDREGRVNHPEFNFDYTDSFMHFVDNCFILTCQYPFNDPDSSNNPQEFRIGKEQCAIADNITIKMMELRSYFKGIIALNHPSYCGDICRDYLSENGVIIFNTHHHSYKSHYNWNGARLLDRQQYDITLGKSIISKTRHVFKKIKDAEIHN